MSGKDISLSKQSLLVDNIPPPAHHPRTEKNKEKKDEEFSFDDALQKSTTKVSGEKNIKDSISKQNINKEEDNEKDEMNIEEIEIKPDVTSIIPLATVTPLPEKEEIVAEITPPILTTLITTEEVNQEKTVQEQSDLLKKIFHELNPEKVEEVKNFVSEKLPEATKFLQNILEKSSDIKLIPKMESEKNQVSLESPEIVNKIFQMVKEIAPQKFEEIENFSVSQGDKKLIEENTVSIFSGVENLVNQAKVNTPPERINIPTQQIEISFYDNNWSDHLGEKILWLINQPIKTAEIHLNPPHLGPLEIHLKMEQENASVNFFTQHAVVKEAIDQALPKLKEILGDNGINLNYMNTHTFEHSQQKNPDTQKQMFEEEFQAMKGVNAKDEGSSKIVTEVSKLGIIDYYA